MTPDAAAPATDPPTCQATRYGAGPCTPDGPRFDVVYTASDGTELDRHPACFRHALAETDRHHASAGIARCDMKGPLRPVTTTATATSHT